MFDTQPNNGPRWEAEEPAALRMATAAPPLALALMLTLLDALARPIVESPLRCGMSELALFLLAPPRLLFAGLLGGGLALALLSHDRPWQRRLSARLAPLSCAAAAVLLLWGGARALRYPTPEHYPQSLPVVAVVPPVEAAGTRLLPGCRLVFQDAIAGLGLILRRTCQSGACDLALLRDGAPIAEVGVVASSQVIHICRDRTLGTLLLEADGRAVGAIEERSLTPRWLFPGELRGRLAVPWGWLLFGLIGLVLALWALAGRRTVWKRLWAAAAGSEGTLLPDGWVHFADGTPPRQAPGPPPLTPLQVVAVTAARAPCASYREDGGAALLAVLAGTRQEIFAAGRAELAARDLIALDLALLSMTPLLAALLSGL